MAPDTAALQASNMRIEEPKPGHRVDGDDYLITHTTTAEGICVYVRRAHNGTILVDIDVSEAGVDSAGADRGARRSCAAQH